MARYWKFFMGPDSIPGDGPSLSASIHHIIKWDKDKGYSMYVKDCKWIDDKDSQDNIKHLVESRFATEISEERAQFYLVIL